MKRWRKGLFCAILAGCLTAWTVSGAAQVPPSTEEVSRYTGILAAAARGDAEQIQRLFAQGEKPNIRDEYGRTPLHVAVFGSHLEAMRVLAKSGVDPNALENDRYDIVTIAAVANDVPALQTALEIGGSARNITSRYDGTALFESIYLGDGGSRHTETLRALVEAGADVNIADRQGQTPLALARVRGYARMVEILQKGKP